MKIEDNTTRQKVRYDSLEYGDVFEHCEQIYMKIHDLEANAVNLINNDLEEFSSYIMVIKLNAKLVIE